MAWVFPVGSIIDCPYWMAVYKLVWDDVINEVVKAQCKRQNNAIQNAARHVKRYSWCGLKRSVSVVLNAPGKLMVASSPRFAKVLSWSYPGEILVNAYNLG